MISPVIQCWLVLLVLRAGQSFSNSGVPCYLLPSGHGCHYSQKPDSPGCTSTKTKVQLDIGTKELNRSIYSLEQELIRLGVIPADNTCSELPDVENGGIIYSNLNLVPGSVGRYICNKGYSLESVNGRNEFNCTIEGIWDGNVTTTPVACILEAKRCPLPNAIKNGNISANADTLLPGDMVVYACNLGYELSGPKNRFCLRNGNWSGQEPECLSKRTETIDSQGAVEKQGMIAGLGVSSTLLLVAVITIVGIITALIAIRIWRHKKVGKRNEVTDSLIVSNEAASPSHRSSDYSSIDEPSGKQKYHASRGSDIYRKHELEDSAM